MTATPADVEQRKDAQKHARLPCKNSTFDEALFRICRDKLLDILADVSCLGRIPEGSPVYEAFARHMALQFQVLVDREIQRLFETDDQLAGHSTWPGHRSRVVSVHHSVVRRRARDLTTYLEAKWNWRARRRRITGICTSVANVLNTTDWRPIVRAFWFAYQAEYESPPGPMNTPKRRRSPKTEGA